MTVQIYAHRGSSVHFAEHSRAAFMQAVLDGADGVECDLRLSSDGAVVLLHDEKVDRTSNGTGRADGHTLAQLRELDFVSWHGATIPPEFGATSEQLLTLEELLDILEGAGRPMELALEFKYELNFDPALIDATLAALGARGWTRESGGEGNVRVSFMSFHPEAVKYLAARVPAAVLCQLLEVVKADKPAAELLNQAMGQGARLVDDGVAHLAGASLEYLRANPDKRERWVAAGRGLRVWTVDTEQDFADSLALGALEVITNRPAEIRALLGAV